MRTEEIVMKKIQMRQTMKLAQNTARQAMSKLQWVCDVDVEPTCLDIEEKGAGEIIFGNRDVALSNSR